MKKKALRSNRNRHTGIINAYKQSIIDNKDSVIKNGYAVLTKTKRMLDVDRKPIFYTVDQVVRL